MGKSDGGVSSPRSAWLTLSLAVAISIAALIGHYLQPMGSWWRAADGELVYTGIRAPIWKTYRFPAAELGEVGMIADPESPASTMLALSVGGVTLKLVDLNPQTVPEFDSYLADVTRLANAVRSGGSAPPVLWIHWANVLVALLFIAAAIMWPLAGWNVLQVGRNDTTADAHTLSA